MKTIPHIPLMMILLSILSSASATQPIIITYTPLPVVLVNGDSFVAFESSNELGLFNATDCTLIRSFKIGSCVNNFDVSADGKHLFVGRYAGKISMWDINTGKIIWKKTGEQTQLEHAFVNIARNGTRCVVGFRNRLVVYDVKTGTEISEVKFPPSKELVIESACLSPDGTKGVLINHEGQVFTFDVKTGEMKNTGITGAKPIRYSVDGKWFVFWSRIPGATGQLSLTVVAADTLKVKYVSVGSETLEARFIDRYFPIGHFKPTTDGSFIYSARDDDEAFGGVYSPDENIIKELWRLRTVDWNEEDVISDFNENTLIGVSSTAEFISKVRDLRTGEVLEATVGFTPYFFPHGPIRTERTIHKNSPLPMILTAVASFVGIVILFVLILLRRKEATVLKGNELETLEVTGITAESTKLPRYYIGAVLILMTLILILIFVWYCYIATDAGKQGKEVLFGAYTDPIPEKYREETLISLNLESRSNEDEYHTINLRLINPTSLPIKFRNYFEPSTWYRIQKWKNEMWVDHLDNLFCDTEAGQWFCGTGTGQCVILSGESSICSVSVEDDLFPIRIGLEYLHGMTTKQQKVVWSERIEKDSLN